MWLTALRFIAAGFFFTAATSAALAQLSPDKVRIGSGLLNLVQNGLGGTVGLAIGTTFLQYRLTVQSSRLDPRRLSASLSWSEMPTTVRDWVQQAASFGSVGDAQVAAFMQRYLSQQATVAAYRDCFILLTILGLASIFLMLLLRKSESFH
jgi:hypothetical protein